MANTYGNSGNRWWVGLNVGENGSQQTAFGTPSIAALNPFTPSGYESLPSGNAADDAKFAAEAKKNKGSKKPGTVNVENINWYNIQGPYSSQSAANAAIPAIQKANPAPGVVGQVAANNGSNPVGAVATAVGAAEQGISSVTDFLTGLTSGNLWLRLVKIVAGGVILIVGLAKITGADKTATGIASKAIRFAPLL